jgi:hypothetical protein
MTPIQSVLYQHPVVPAGTAQFARTTDNAKTPDPLVAAGELSAAWIENHLADTLEVRLKARPQRPFAIAYDMPEIMDLSRAKLIASLENPSLPGETREATSTLFLRLGAKPTCATCSRTYSSSCADSCRIPVAA